MNPHWTFAMGGLALLLPLWSETPPLERVKRDGEARFDALKMHVEVDLPSLWGSERHQLRREALLLLPAEVVLVADSGVPLQRLRTSDSLGRTVLELTCSDSAEFSVTELSVEAGGLTLGQAMQAYPPGAYHVEATTIEGDLVTGTVSLNYGFPGLFAVVSPEPGDDLSGDVAISWTPSKRAVRYIMEIEQSQLGFSFEITLPASQTTFTVPEAFLASGRTYEYSLSVEGDTDNQLELEGTFSTTPAYVGDVVR